MRYNILFWSVLSILLCKTAACDDDSELVSLPEQKVTFASREDELQLDSFSLKNGCRYGLNLRIINATGKTVEFKDIAADCSCASGKMSPAKLEPNSEGLLAVTIKTSTIANEQLSVFRLASLEEGELVPKVLRVRVPTKLSQRLVLEPSVLTFDPREIVALSAKIKAVDTRDIVEKIEIVGSSRFVAGLVSDDLERLTINLHKRCELLRTPIVENIAVRFRDADGKSLTCTLPLELRPVGFFDIVPRNPDFRADGEQVFARVMVTVPKNDVSTTLKFTLEVNNASDLDVATKVLRDVGTMRMVMLTIDRKMLLGLNEAVLVMNADDIEVLRLPVSIR